MTYDLIEDERGISSLGCYGLSQLALNAGVLLIIRRKAVASIRVVWLLLLASSAEWVAGTIVCWQF
jgi:hypothetical protein